MYRAIWRLLPGPGWLKVVEAIVLLGLVLAALHFWVFPWAQEQLGLDEVQVEEAAALPVALP